MERKIANNRQRGTLAHRLLRQGLCAGLALTALPCLADEPDSLALDTMSYDLDAVTVSVQRKLIKNDIDKLTYDVANDETARTKNTLELLRSVPLVTVDGQENISVKGSSSFKVYRNGHPDPSLSSQNLKDVLKAIPASQIKKIEVITDPGAKEDAEGTQYILNLVMKSSAGMTGVMGTVYASYKPLRKEPSVGGMITAQKGKWASSLNYGFAHSYADSGNDQDLLYVNSGNRLLSHSLYDVMANVHYGNLSTSYEVDSLNLVTMNLGGFYYDVGTHPVTAYYRMTNNGATLYSYNVLATLPTFNSYNIGGRIDYQHKTHTEGETLTTSYQLQSTRSHQDKSLEYTEAVNMPANYTANRNNNRSTFVEHTLQIDYMRPLGSLFKWNTGAKYILRSNKSDVWNTYTGAEEMNQNVLFDHHTQVAGLYTEWIYTGGKIQARGGLRYEHSYLQGKYPDGSHKDFSKRLNDWVPSASVRYAWSEAQSLKFSFSTNINRPGIEYLNPAEDRQPTSLEYGNPGLNSSRIYNMSLEYNYITSKVTLMGGISHNFSNNQISDLMFEQDGLTVSTYGDHLHYRTWMVWGFIQASLWKGANVNGGPNVFNVTYKDRHTGLQQRRWSCWNTINFTQKLPWKLQFSAYCGFNIGRKAASVYEYTEPTHNWYASLSRNFLKEERLSVRIGVGNLFEPSIRTYQRVSTQGDFRGPSTTLYSGKELSISVSWRFGKLNGGVKKVNRSIENNDVVGGISTGNSNQKQH